MRKKVVLAGVTSLVLGVSAAGSAQALASSRWPFTVGGGRTVYYFYGDDYVSGSLATASTQVGGNPCLLYTKNVRATIRLPNGSSASRSSLLGQCSTAISIAKGSYSALQIKSTHTLNLWNGQTWTYVD